MMKRNNSHFPHALLISGGSSEGRFEKALFCAKGLLCLTETAQQACNACQACNWVDQFAHPDLCLLPATAKSLKKSEIIKINEIREIIQFLGYRPHQSKNKIVIISQAENMPPGAANALLKTLEEPPENSYLFLLTQYPHLLPITIRSRCQKMLLPVEKAHAVSPDLITQLKETLIQLKKKQLTVFEAAAKWKDYPLLDVLDGLYYCVLSAKQLYPGLFKWCDHVNAVRQQVLSKQNPNHLLALENIFYQWIYCI